MVPVEPTGEVFMTDTVKRGFAAMSPERQREIAAMGGRSVPKSKRTFRKNRALASTAGRKGGKSVPAEKRTFACDPELARRAGCRGGRATPSRQRAFARVPGLARRAADLRHARKAAGDQSLVCDVTAKPI